jgi:flagellin
MPIGILNNIASLAAENQLTVTNSNLQNVLAQLSSGDRINSGADDPAGLAIANGLQANVAALTQSEQNVSDGTGMLQVADGALSQVITLLNRAVTLATESSTGTVSDSQRVALQSEFSQITAEIDQIGSNTTFNGAPNFAGDTENYNQIQTGGAAGTGGGLTTAINGQITFYAAGSSTALYTTNDSDETMGDMINDINSSGTGLVAALGSNGQLIVTDTLNRGIDAGNALQASTTNFWIGGATPADNTAQVQMAGTTGQAVTGTFTITPTSGGSAYTTSANDATTDELSTDINSHSSTTGVVANFSGSNIIVTETDGGAITVAPSNGAEIGGLAAAVDAIGGGNTGDVVASVYNPANSNTMNVFLSDSTVAGSGEIG